MHNNGSSFTYLDEAAIEAAKVNATPYEWAYTPAAIPNRFVDQVLADAPRIPDRGGYALPDLKYGPEFAGIVNDLLSDRFRKIVEKKFGMDLSKSPPSLVMMGNTSGMYNEGYPHTDSRHKIVTVILGLTRAWPFERGRMRILNGPDIGDCAFEFAPEFGGLCMFKVCGKSWHGFLPQKGPRMSLQLCYCDSEDYVKKEYRRHHISAVLKSVPGLSQLIGLLPRKNPSSKAHPKK